MNGVVFCVLVGLLLPAGLAWGHRLRTPMVLVTLVGLAGALVASLVAPVDWPALRPWAMVACVLLAAVGGGPVTAEVLARVRASVDADARAELAEEYASPELADLAAEAMARPAPVAAHQLRGGKWIGVLERAGVAASLVCGWPEGIAIVLAVKGLGRYPELQQGTTERFIIGTFASVLFAAGACGVLLVAH